MYWKVQLIISGLFSCVVGSDPYIRCATEGEQFWCASVYNANLCNARRYCELEWQKQDIKQGFEKVLLPSNQMDTCPLCIEIASTIKNIVNETQDNLAITKRLEEVCHSFNGTIIKFMCESYVRTHGPHIIQLLREITRHPKVMCMKHGACPSIHLANDEILQHENAIILNKIESRLCRECKFVIYDAEGIFNNKFVQNAIKKEMLKVCSGMDACEFLVNTYFDQVYEYMFVISTPDQVCSRFGFCEN